ncbi:hypothetical protein DWX58_04000 [Pseudoflavonifractor sp. AF19-9AC]|uniref:hypothetical protein n=1 Tax=Pseudoflavonifractor sp. AF19-9AC TaxID=2292244 RepID=UPI000E4F2901|nr:hypothetical protein [Pseudoflavonifractor sp. AF19-9AC]RHR10564.1 hypothetical protein DWX58_04000 [Pseudoflavonifractor sp. AF19-9AC]
MDTNSPHLLEHLAHLAGLTYLSDLRWAAPASFTLYKALANTPAAAFSLRQWQEALAYLTGEPRAPASADLCRQRLLEHFSQTNSGRNTGTFPLDTGSGG